MILIFIAGLLCGAAATVHELYFENQIFKLQPSRQRRTRTVIELLSATVIGTIAHCLAFNAGLLPAVATAIAFALMTRVAIWYFGNTQLGVIQLELIADMPPAIFVALGGSYSFWSIGIASVMPLITAEPIGDSAHYVVAAVWVAVTWAIIGLALYRRELNA